MKVKVRYNVIATLDNNGDVMYTMSEYGWERDGNSKTIVKYETMEMEIDHDEAEFRIEVIGRLIKEKEDTINEAEEKVANIDTKLLALAQLGYFPQPPVVDPLMQSEYYDDNLWLND